MRESFTPHTYPGETHHNRIKPFDKGETSTAFFPSSEAAVYKEIVSTFNENILHELFAELFQKSGSAIASMNFIPLSDIQILQCATDEIPTGMAFYSSSRNTINIISNFCPKNADTLLWIVIHEELHAVSQDNFRITNDIDKDLVRGEERGGYHVRGSYASISDGSTGQYSFWNNLNEGMTELITERIYLAYQKRAGLDRDSKGGMRFVQYLQNNEAANPYANTMKRIVLYVGILAAICDVPPETIKDSLIRGYLRNSSPVPIEIESLFESDPEISILFRNLLENTDTDPDNDLTAIVDAAEEAGYFKTDEQKQKVTDAISDVWKRTQKSTIAEKILRDAIT